MPSQRKKYSHRVDVSRVKKEVEARFDRWITSKKAEIKATPFSNIDWQDVLNRAIWRQLPFTPDSKNPKNEKGFRDMIILETVTAICNFYAEEVNIAFICNDYALRRATEERLGNVESFSIYESLKDFESFIELTKKNLTERFVKSILNRAKNKFHSEKDKSSLIYKDDFAKRLRKEFIDKIEKPSVTTDLFSFLGSSESDWKHVGKERTWVTRPQFEKLEENNKYHWKSVVTVVRLYERDSTALSAISGMIERRLMILSIDVIWKSTVRADGRFFDCEVVDYKADDKNNI